MPLTITLLRHGESEVNVANILDRKGDYSLAEMIVKSGILDENIRLTEKGASQAKLVGQYIKKMGFSFDGFVVSSFKRAEETAYYLDISDKWLKSSNIIERGWGKYMVRPDKNKPDYNNAIFDGTYKDFLWYPTGGESRAAVYARIHLFFNYLFQHFSFKHLFIVAHGESIEMMKMYLSGLSANEYSEYIRNKEHSVKNCQLVQFSRVTPNGRVIRNYNWTRTLSYEDKTINPWNRISREIANITILSSIDLKIEFESSPRMFL